VARKLNVLLAEWFEPAMTEVLAPIRESIAEMKNEVACLEQVFPLFFPECIELYRRLGCGEFSNCIWSASQWHWEAQTLKHR
jgi:hypothetical protein